ncbi:MAG: hypothetical protein QOD06_2162 [Candidatus Binatota bacterium]|nr:hypothetical protein [Candidatus Binatota bacterium]
MRSAPLVLLLCLGAAVAAAAEAPINVVVVSLDTLRPDHLGCYGYPRATSPAIDEFRRDAVLFAQAISQAPSTLPSHASIFTSLWPRHHDASQMKQRALAGRFQTLAEVLRDHGYATASFNGGAQVGKAYGLDQGFDTFSSEHRDDFSATVGDGLAWLHSRRPAKFFLFLHTYAVHHPYEPDPAKLHAFEPSYFGPLPAAISLQLLTAINEGRFAIDERDLTHMIAAYDAEIRATDDAFAKLIDGLRRDGLYDPTMIVLLSDHGEEFREHGRVGWHAHSLYDELLRIALVVKLPAAAHRGAAVKQQVRAIDVAPTVLAAAGIEIPEQFEGVNLLPILDGERIGPLVAFANLDGGRPIAVRTEEWKLYGRKLFDLANDPGERKDVAAEHPDVSARLKQELRGMLQKEQAIAAPKARPDRETVERLKSLGYVH